MREYLNYKINRRIRQIKALKELPTYPENYPTSGPMDAQIEINLTRLYCFEDSLREYQFLLKLLDSENDK